MCRDRAIWAAIGAIVRWRARRLPSVKSVGVAEPGRHAERVVEQAVAGEGGVPWVKPEGRQAGSDTPEDGGHRCYGFGGGLSVQPGTFRNSVCERAYEQFQAMACVKRSP